jgi:GTP-binding protein HflX
VPQILVCNKIDRLDATARPRVLQDETEGPDGRRGPRVFVSALQGLGLDTLREAIARAAREEIMSTPVFFDAPDGHALA